MDKITARKKRGDAPRTLHYSILIAGLLIVIPLVIGFLAFFSIGPPISGSEGTGYFTFQIIDTHTGLEIDGEIAITNFETGELIDIYDSDEIIYTSTSIIATIYSVDLDPSDTRTVLPFTIVPIVDGTENDPQVNTIGAYFYFPKENITVDIVELDDIAGSYNESDIEADTLHELELDIDVDRGSSNSSIYGASSYVPEHMLPTKSASEDITGFGLWLFLNETEVVEDSVTVEGFDTNAYYIESEDYSIILLHPVYDGGLYQDQTVTLECKTQPTSIGIFQGFIDDLDTTFVQIL